MDQNKTYLESKINPILEPLVTDLIINKPQEPAQYMITWLQKQYGKRKTVEEKKSFKSLRSKTGGDGSENESISEEGEEDDQIEDLPHGEKVISQNRKAISAECYGTWNKQEAFEPIVISKTQDQKDLIHEKLTKSFLFNSLEEKELQIVIDAIKEMHFKPGEYVITQGDEGNCLYVVSSGQLDCTKKFKPDQDEPTHLKVFEAGEAFGELALLYMQPRAANIIAKTDCSLFCLDRDTFNHIVKDSAREKRQRYEDFLKKVKLLSSMDDYERSKLADAFKSLHFQSGEYIIKEGEEGNTFYFLEEGECFATKRLETGQPPKKVFDYSVGDYFGELALLKNAPRAANIIAKTDCVVVCLERHCFKRLLGPLEEILKRNMEVYSQYLDQ